MLAEEIQAATLGATMAARQKGGHMTIDSDAPHPPRTRYAPRLRLLFAWVLMIMIMSFFFQQIHILRGALVMDMMMLAN